MKTLKKPRLVSGITATGTLTLGNYLGAIKNFVALQDQYEMYIFIADLHALTIDIAPQLLRKNRRDIFALYIAAGLDPNRTTIFYQSDIAEHSELGWILTTKTTLGELSRMTQFKDKQAQNKKSNSIPTGLLIYPTLMAADILLYNPTVVPTGIDQKQHLELTRNIAARLNHKYATKLLIPEPYFAKVGTKIMSLTDPTKKMSKSSLQPKSYISLLDDPEEAAQKIRKAVTDSENKVYIADHKPGVVNLLTIYAALSDLTLQAAAQHFVADDYQIFKAAVALVVKTFLETLQAKYQVVLKDVAELAIAGAAKAKPLAAQNLQAIKQRLGLN